MLLFHFGTVKTKHLTHSFVGFARKLIIHEMKKCVAVLPAKMSWFKNHITYIYFVLFAAVFENSIKTLYLK